MLYLLPIIAVPALIMLAFKLTHSKEFTIGEFLGLEAFMIVTLLAMFALGKSQTISDYEIWNGRITEKTSGSQHCCHCRTVCDTCTRTVDGRTETYSCRCRQVCNHFRDYWWSLEVTTGDVIPIVSCQSNRHNVPAAWKKAKIGEPASVAHNYKNYLLADPDSLFVYKETNESFSIPEYPKVKNFYRINRAFSDGVTVSTSKYNTLLSELNADLGSKKQVNIVLFLTDKPPSYAEAVEKEWLYGKKNDLIFVLGVKDSNKVSWARVVTISNVEELKLKARDGMIGMDVSDYDRVIEHIGNLVENDFNRTPMSEYEYLYASATPSTLFMFFMYLIGIIVSVAGSYILVHNDHRETPRSRWDRY